MKVRERLTLDIEKLQKFITSRHQDKNVRGVLHTKKKSVPGGTLDL